MPSSLEASMQQAGPNFPPEVSDYILDHCHDDKLTLAASSLVSHSFNVACRYHLLAKNIDISNGPERGEDREKIPIHTESESEEGTNINPASSAASFIRIVLAPSSTIAPFLQELSLVLRPSEKKEVLASAWLDELLALLPATKTDCTKFSNAATASPFHLRTLRLFRHGVDLSAFALTALHQNFPTITTLAFFETTLHRRSLRRDMEWVCGFANLEDLLFYGHHRANKRRVGDEGVAGMNVSVDGDTSAWVWNHPLHSFDLNEAVNAQGTTTIRLPQSIRSLRLDLPGPALEAFMQWLLSHAKVDEDNEKSAKNGRMDIPRVSTLHLFRVMDDEVPGLRAYLNECVDTLEEVMMFLYQRTTNREDFDFSQHSALRTLFLASHGFKPMQVLHDIVSTTRSCHMQKLLLQFPRWQLATDDDAWEALDTLLSTSKSQLTISAVVDEARKGDSEEKLKTRLPLSVASPKEKFTVMKRNDKVVAGYVDEVYARMSTF
ncbi:hypothetical protein BT96DRAFT_986330 [Gymnopus androsaceus JB14]|uniref:F-box domain-containing protein n=1 Tax=Gymnopus androsaceus JB14 TaxID=1447944 RepID=A0A6A4IEG4_9AGAR|nr:hypothetical protein BT96DRAFT_986330 [Gymnopus androsaceus JB14]